MFFCSSRRRHTRSKRDWSSDVCSSDLPHSSLYVFYSQKRRYLSVCGQFSHLHLQRFVNVQCRHLRFLLISSVSLLLSDIGKLLLHFHSHSLVFGSIQFNLLTHSLPIWMGILPSWIHQFHKRIFEVSWSDPPVFPLVIFDYNEPLYGWLFMAI